jgi:hypothetical protein
MKYLLAVAVAFILGGTSYALRPIAEASPTPVHRESMAEVIGAVVEACIRGGGTWVNEVQGERVTGRCHPIERVGVVKVRGSK